MSQSLTEWQGIQHGLSALLHKMSVEHVAIAFHSKLTLFEMLQCLEMSTEKGLPIDHVFKKMAEFKQSSAHILYKRKFL